MSDELAFGLGPLLFFLVTLAVTIAADFFGYRVGSRIGPPNNEAQAAAINTTLAAIFVIVGLILSFTFSFVVNIAQLRWSTMVQQADAIGTTYLRADALQPADRDLLRASLRRYTDTMIEFYRTSDPKTIAADNQRIGQAEQQMWSASASELNRRNTFALSLLQQTMNDTFDRGADMRAALNLRLRGAATSLIVLAAVLAAFLIGLAFGQSRTSNWLISIAFCILLVALMFVIVDLNNPRGGIIQLNASPLVDVRSSMQGP